MYNPDEVISYCFTVGLLSFICYIFDSVFLHSVVGGLILCLNTSGIDIRPARFRVRVSLRAYYVFDVRKDLFF